MDPLVFIIFRNNLNGYGDLYHGAYVGAASPKAGPNCVRNLSFLSVVGLGRNFQFSLTKTSFLIEAFSLQNQVVFTSTKKVMQCASGPHIVHYTTISGLLFSRGFHFGLISLLVFLFILE